MIDPDPVANTIEVDERLSALERRIGELEISQNRLACDFDSVYETVKKLIAKVNEFVGRFTVVGSSTKN